MLRAMADAIAHRGPDDHGTWSDLDANVHLAHRRLSVLDTSPAGHQPMESASGRYRIVFNGEVYNHMELRRDLVGNRWRGHSDTETLLACIDRWGLAATLSRCVGMFAFALWDSSERTLFLARDRFGEKPLYYGWQSGVFLFGSELKALKAHPAFSAEIDRGVAALFLRRGYVPAPYSIYRDIRKVEPGSFLAVTGASQDVVATVYWSAREAAQAARRTPFEATFEEATVELDKLLAETVSAQMLSDVPLGAFLSGGIDSSTIVALMQAGSARPIKTFTVGFDATGYDEATHAKAVASHLGTDHHELRVTEAEALAVIPELPAVYDEPFADSSQIPTLLVSRLARSSVTVSLSGDGGDEVFGGYNRHVIAARLWRTLRRWPRAVRWPAAEAMRALSPEKWDAIFRSLGPLVPRSWRYGQAGNKAHKLANVVSSSSSSDLYGRLISQWQRRGELLQGAAEPPTVLDDDASWADAYPLEAQMMLLDTIGYLPDDILVKVDRAAMAVSLETRVPFLDHRVFEFAWRLPLFMKVENGVGKRVLREVLNRYVPPSLWDRPKSGFAIPLDAWLRGPLRSWAESLLASARLMRDGYISVKVVERLWQQHLSGRANHGAVLWNVLMLQQWLAAR